MPNSKWLGLAVLVAAFAVAGCGGQQSAAPPNKNTTKGKDDDDDHEHGPGPHGGLIIEFGKYHGEFTVDHPKKQVTVYILDGSAKKAAPIAAEKLMLSIKSPAFQVELKAMPQDGDPKGKASRFVATHDNFGKEQEFAGTVSGEVDGKQYAGEFEEKPHGHEKK